MDLRHEIAIQQTDYKDLFDTVEHDISCEKISSASIRLHFVRHDRGCMPMFDVLAETLVTYIIQYCFKASRRKNLTTSQTVKTFLQAKKLFRDNPRTGQPGEMLIYFLIEAVLGAPQVVQKMPITTNPNDERKGSDGIHARWLEAEKTLEVIFAEAKLHAKFSNAMEDAFKSMSSFHTSSTKALEIDFFLDAFRDMDTEVQALLKSYLRGGNRESCQDVHACLIGYSWLDYQELDDAKKREEFCKDFKARYAKWANEVLKPALDKGLNSFTQHHVRLEFFFIPFKSVDDFRALFLSHLGMGNNVDIDTDE